MPSLMKTLEAVRAQIDITAGGAGSGCHGENCGRPPAGKTPGGLEHDATNVKEGKLTSAQKAKLDHEYKYWKKAAKEMKTSPYSSGATKTVERHGNMVVSHTTGGGLAGSTRTAWIDKAGKFQVQIVSDKERPEAKQEAEAKTKTVTTEFKEATKKLGLPSGGNKGEGYYTWSKSGGYAGAKVIARVRENAVKAGFKQASSSSTASPDGGHVVSGDKYTKGNVSIEFHKHYGVTKSDNSFSIRVEHTKK